jgi:deazaflavin-dependent oxidoreductase (nitroreductase family)
VRSTEQAPTRPPASRDPEDFNSKTIKEFRSNGGRVGGPLANTPLILIHHIGAKSGIERVTPLAFTLERDGRYLIVASNGGSPTNPRWYYNIKANPRIEVEIGHETFTALAKELEGRARNELWPKLVAASPALREYESKTARRIPLLALTRDA